MVVSFDGKQGTVQDDLSVQYYVIWDDGTRSFVFKKEVKIVSES